MNILLPSWPDAPANVRAFTTLRNDGVSCAPYDDGAGHGGFNVATHVGDDLDTVRQNRQRLREMLPAEPVWLNQIHGTTVVDAAAASGVPDADASITAKMGIVCAVMTADCLPVLLCDTQGTVVSAAHAGWRGLLNGVLQAAVATMRSAGAAEIVAWLGPAIGPRSFEVGPEARQAFVSRDGRAEACFVRTGSDDEKYLADIYALARLALSAVGVERISGGDRCTVAEPQEFYSYRRDGRTGRMVTLIWLDR
jgi:YfiH family protein